MKVVKKDSKIFMNLALFEQMLNLNIIPEPKTILCKDESIFFELTINQKITIGFVSELEEMQILIEKFKNEFEKLTNNSIDILKIKSSKDPCTIYINLDKTISPLKYIITIEETIKIEGGSIQAIHWATVSLLQMLPANDQTQYSIRFHKCIIEDQPQFEYNGLMVDLARQWHPLSVVKQCVLLCRWYKIRYLHLHFADDQSFTLPIKSYPKLSSKKRSYSREEIIDLERFAHERGVIIVPEIDWLGHSYAMVSAYPKIFGVGLTRWGKPRENTINIGKADIIETLQPIVKDICELFPRSPYFHLGADEVSYNSYKKNKEVQDTMKKLGISDIEELYRQFIVQMNEVVKQNGKQMCVWEGFRATGHIKIPNDIWVFVFESMYNPSDQLVKDGYNVVNTSWQPIYITPNKNWTPEQIYKWNPNRWENWFNKSLAFKNPIEIPYSNQLKGAQMCSWENSAKTEISLIRQRLAAFSEKVWYHEIQKSYSEFQVKLEIQDKKLDIFLKIC